MQVIAYTCDHCKKLALSKNMYGITVLNPDMFNLKYIYSLEVNPSKSLLHVCSNCIAELVTDPVERMDFKRGTDEYKKAYNELLQNLFLTVHRKTNFK